MDSYLYDPINTLKPVADGVWIADGSAVRFAGVPFPTRMTILRLSDGGLFVHSPTALTPSLKAEVDALGPVRHLVAPNKLHYWWIGEWQRAYPEALAHAAPKARERARRRRVAFDCDLGSSAPPQWAEDILQVAVRSHYMTEVAFFHRSSRTLVLADLIENFETHRAPWLMRWVARLGGAVDPDGRAQLAYRVTFAGLHKAARAAVRTMIDWDPERVILAHGRWYSENGTAELRRAFRWLGPL